MTPADVADPLLPRLRRAATDVFGDSPIGAAILERCDDYEAERNRMLAARGGDQPVLAVIGAAGQGKTWLVRALVRDPAVRKALPSGDRSNERTRQVAWIGARPPNDFDPARERYLSCANDQMYPLGIPYLLVDTPGISDVEPVVAEAARLAVSQATAHLLVVRRDQLRAGEIDVLAIASEGALIVPVISVVHQRDAALVDDTQRLLERIRSLAPTSQILEPVYIDDCERDGHTFESVANQAAHDLAQRLSAHLRELSGGQRMQLRLAAARKRFRRDLADQLRQQLPELSLAERRLRDAADRLPIDVAETLIGSPAALSVAVRTRLRLALLHHTSAIWFPFRTLLSVLNLTHGAWDRLLLAMAGSLPSLITTAWSGLSNLRQLSDLSSDRSQAVHQRAQSLVQDRLRPVLGAFHRELERLRQGESRRQLRDGQATARLLGVDALQTTSLKIFDEQIHRHAASPFASFVLAVGGTALFWLMLAGPIFALYREYGGSSYQELTGQNAGWHAFPEPSAAMMLTSVLLSLLPTALYAMSVLAWAQSARRVNACANGIQQAHQDAIANLRDEGTLQLEFDDPLVDDARVLLSIGHAVDAPTNA